MIFSYPVLILTILGLWIGSTIAVVYLIRAAPTLGEPDE
jgi:hypothetical protein